MNISTLTMDQIIQVDRLMIEEYGIQLTQMMENAGRNLAEQARRLLGGGLTERRIVVLCGAGHNGGGGMVAARHLHNRGAQVQTKLISPASHLKDVTLLQWRILKTMNAVSDQDPNLNQADLIIDAIIGYRLRGNPRNAAAEWINRANTSTRPILALDNPSGLDVTTGKPGSPCIQATATLTLALPKVGLFAAAAKPFVGRLYLADIGVPPQLYRRLGLDIGTIFESDTIISINAK